MYILGGRHTGYTSILKGVDTQDILVYIMGVDIQGILAYLRGEDIQGIQVYSKE